MGMILLDLNCWVLSLYVSIQVAFLSDHDEVWSFDWDQINLRSLHREEWKSFEQLFVGPCVLV